MGSSMNRIPASLVLFVALAAAASPAAAQSIDYGQYEAIFGEPVTTSATGAPQRASDVPAAMIIIRGEDLRRSGAINLAEALRGRAGIDVNRFGAQHYDVTVRGANQPFNPRLLVMVNGRQIYLDHYGLTSWSNLGIELSEIRQIEIVKGPVSALFGFNAAAGAINIITYNPVSDRVNAASAEAGSDHARAVSAVGSMQFGDALGMRLSGGYARQDEFTAAGNVRPYRRNLALDAGFAASSMVTARFSYSYADSKQLMEAPSFFQVIMGFRTHGAQADISADTAIGLIGASVDYNDLVNRYDLSLDGRYEGLFHTKLLIAHLQDIIKPGPRDTIRATIEYRRNQMTQKPDLSGRAGYEVYSGGMMWDHRFSDKLTANVAGRFEHLNLAQSGAIDPLIPFSGADFDRHYTAWSANAGLVIKPDSLSSIRIQAARGVQVPSLIALGVALRAPVVPGVFAGFSGNPALNPAVIESGEIGYARAFDAKTNFRIAAFYSRTRNILTLDQSPPTLLPGVGLLIEAQFNSGGHSESYGIESTLQGAIGERVNWQIDYTFNAVNEAFPAGLPQTNRPFRELTPRHKLGARIGYDDGRFTIDGRALLRSRVTFPLNGRESGWSAGLDAHAGWRLTPALRFFATGENLTGAAYIDNGRARQDVRGRIGMGLGL